MQNLSLANLNEFFFIYETYFTIFQVSKDLKSRSNLDKENTDRLNDITKGSVLRAIKEDSKLYSNFDNVINEIRENSYIISEPKDLKKYHFYLLKRINFFEEKFKIVFDDRYKLKPDNQFNKILLKYFETWNSLKIQIGEEINWEIDETIRFQRDLEVKYEDEFGKSMTESNQKITWNAGPSYLGFLFDELERNGYITFEGLTSNEKKAGKLLSIFNLNTTKGTLAKMLSENTNALTGNSRGRISIKPPTKEKEN